MESKEKAMILLNLVCDELNLPVNQVAGKSRRRVFCEARQVSCSVIAAHTSLIQTKITALLGYKDHASVVRDIRNVPEYLKLRKEFREKYLPVIEKAQEKANQLRIKEIQIAKGGDPAAGDICWFWYSITSEMPRIGTLLYIEETDEGTRYVAREFFGDFDNCCYAGRVVLPEKFLQQIKAKTEQTTTVNETQQGCLV